MNDKSKPAAAAPFEPQSLQVVNLDRQVRRVAFSPCGRYLLATGYDANVLRWEVSADPPMEFAPLTGNQGWSEALVFGPAETVLASDSWGGLRCWCYADESTEPRWSLPTAHDGWLHDLALSPDGQQVASCGNDGCVRLWSTADGTLIKELTPHTEALFRIAFHPAGESLVAGDLHGRVKQWSLATGEIAREFDASYLHKSHRLQEVGGVRTLGFNAAGTLLAVGGTYPDNGGNVQGNPTLILFDWNNGKELEKLQFGEQGEVYVTDVSFLPEDILLAVTSGGPGKGKILFTRRGEKAPLYESTKVPNIQSLSVHLPSRRFAVSSVNVGSNGNGRRLDKNGNYLDNHSPLHLFTLPAEIKANA